MGRKAKQAEALIASLDKFQLPYDPDLVVNELRDQGLHPLADLVEGLHDEVHILRTKLARAERKVRKRRKPK